MSCSDEACLLINAKEENTNLAAKELYIYPISEKNQREIAGSEILKIFVRYRLPASRVIMAGTAEY